MISTISFLFFAKSYVRVRMYYGQEIWARPSLNTCRSKWGEEGWHLPLFINLISENSYWVLFLYESKWVSLFLVAMKQINSKKNNWFVFYVYFEAWTQVRFGPVYVWCVRDRVTFLSWDPTHFFGFKSQLDIAKKVEHAFSFSVFFFCF